MYPFKLFAILKNMMYNAAFSSNYCIVVSPVSRSSLCFYTPFSHILGTLTS